MRYAPHNYQRYCIDRVISQPEIGLFLDMGLGKSSITLTAVNELLYNRFQARKVLVIAPKKVAELTWTTEAKKWDHLKHLRVSVCLGSERDRIRALNKPADIYVINRENVSWLVGHYGNDWPFDMLIIDELSSFKSHSAKRFKDLKKVRPHIRRIVGLTGTPAPNGIMDLWSQVYLLDGGKRLYDSITKFRARYFDEYQADAYGRRGYSTKAGAFEMVSRNIQDLCISMKAADYLELPDLIEHEVWVALDDKAKAAYREMEKQMILSLPEGEEITAMNGAALSNKLLQLCNGAVYDENGEYHEVHNCKIEAMLETIEQLHGQRVLVFYSFKHDKDRILKALPKSLRIRELKKPEDQIDWNNGEIDVLLAHPASAGHGLNLQEGGNHMIWFGLNWSLELYQQAVARLYRQGQKEKVIVHHLLVKGGRDEDVAAAIRDKTVTQDELIARLKARIVEIRRLN